MNINLTNVFTSTSAGMGDVPPEAKAIARKFVSAVRVAATGANIKVTAGNGMGAGVRLPPVIPTSRNKFSAGVIVTHGTGANAVRVHIAKTFSLSEKSRPTYKMSVGASFGEFFDIRMSTKDGGLSKMATVVRGSRIGSDAALAGAISKISSTLAAFAKLEAAKREAGSKAQDAHADATILRSAKAFLAGKGSGSGTPAPVLKAAKAMLAEKKPALAEAERNAGREVKDRTASVKRVDSILRKLQLKNSGATPKELARATKMRASETKLLKAAEVKLTKAKQATMELNGRIDKINSMLTARKDLTRMRLCGGVRPKAK